MIIRSIAGSWPNCRHPPNGLFRLIIPQRQTGRPAKRISSSEQICQRPSLPGRVRRFPEVGLPESVNPERNMDRAHVLEWAWYGYARNVVVEEEEEVVTWREYPEPGTAGHPCRARFVRLPCRYLASIQVFHISQQGLGLTPSPVRATY
jgi:hypothetical protein